MTVAVVFFPLYMSISVIGTAGIMRQSLATYTTPSSKSAQQTVMVRA